MILNLSAALLFSLLSFISPAHSEAPQASLAEATCNAKPYIDFCISKLPQGYTFLKSYPINGENGAKKMVRFSYVFSKGMNYFIRIANNTDDTAPNGVFLRLKDSSQKEVASTLSGGGKEYLKGLAYTCNTTGIYYLEYHFDKTNNYCAGGVLAFKR